jgi:hypothetical protein
MHHSSSERHHPGCSELLTKHKYAHGAPALAVRCCFSVQRLEADSLVQRPKTLMLPTFLKTTGARFRMETIAFLHRFQKSLVWFCRNAIHLKKSGNNMHPNGQAFG